MIDIILEFLDFRHVLAEVLLAIGLLLVFLFSFKLPI
jgi:hypothetical protein